MNKYFCQKHPPSSHALKPRNFLFSPLQPPLNRLLLSLPACLSSCCNCFQICVGGQGLGVLLHAKFINRAVFPDGHWLQPGEQVDWDQNNNRWRTDNEFLNTYFILSGLLPLPLLTDTIQQSPQLLPALPTSSNIY